MIAAGLRLSPSRVPISISERSAAKASSASVPAKHEPGSISAMKLRRRDVEALEHALEVVADLAHQPVAVGLGEEVVVIEHGLRVAVGAQQHDADGRLVGAQMQDGVFQFARHRERPELGAERVRGLDRGRHGLRTGRAR